MTTLDAINRKLARFERDRVLRASLFGPNRIGGRRSKSVHDMPVDGKVTGCFVPDWLRVRAERYFRAHIGEVPSMRAMILIGLYELTKNYADEAVDIEAVDRIREHPDAEKFGWRK